MKDDMREMTAEEVGALCTNLQKACTKQLRSKEAALFGELASYYEKEQKNQQTGDIKSLLTAINRDLADGYVEASKTADNSGDRGAKRALVWGEKASKLLKALLMRYEKQGHGLLENTNVWVCEICGFVYVGDVPPSVCPICKVPSFKIHSIQKEAL
ncbi:MAG: rubredoxin-like domain-containing protein [Sphaerochaetaceae bacterium]